MAVDRCPAKRPERQSLHPDPADAAADIRPFFSSPERRQLGERAAQGERVAQQEETSGIWDEQRAALMLPLLRRILALPPHEREKSCRVTKWNGCAAGV
ncbi:hypothetical protein ABR759_02205 [Escherichia coli]